MHLSARSISRPLLASALLLALAACSNGLVVDGDLKGRINGRDTQMSLHTDSRGDPVLDGTLGNDAPNRDIAPGFAIIGGNTLSSSVRGSKCLVDPCPPVAEFQFDTPPPLVYAGTWKNTNATLSFTDEDFYPVAAVGFTGKSDRFELTFDEPSYSSSGDVTMVNTGKVSGTSVNGGETLEFSGNFRLEYQCHPQSVYYRHCGNFKEEGKKNPINRPYTENTCPAELVAPYEGDPTWKGNTLKLGDFSISCREGNSGPENPTKPLLCYQRRTNVSADGCRWNVHFLTDGQLQQFAVAAFGQGACAQRTCNTYR